MTIFSPWITQKCLEGHEILQKLETFWDTLQQVWLFGNVTKITFLRHFSKKIQFSVKIYLLKIASQKKSNSKCLRCCQLEFQNILLVFENSFGNMLKHAPIFRLLKKRLFTVSWVFKKALQKNKKRFSLLKLLHQNQVGSILVPKPRPFYEMGQFWGKFLRVRACTHTHTHTIKNILGI